MAADGGDARRESAGARLARMMESDQAGRTGDPVASATVATADHRLHAPAWLEAVSSDAADDVEESKQAEPHDDWDDDWDDWAPPRARWKWPRGAVVAVAAVALLLVSYAAWSVFAGPSASTPPLTLPSPGPVAALSRAPSGVVQPTEIVVSVVGLVRKPGLVHLPTDARVADALAAAGGTTPDADTQSLNLAARLHDGDQILVGVRTATATLGSAVVPGAGGTGVSGAPPGATSPGAAVDINTATVEQLDTLPGVGPVTAAAIVQWRTAHGRFENVDQLAEVDGIGPARLEKLRALVVAR